MSGFQSKDTNHAKRQRKAQSKNIKQASEAYSDMTQILELSGRESKITKIC